MAYKQNQLRITPNSELMKIVCEEARKMSLPVSTYARISLVAYLKSKGIKFNNN